MSEEGQARQLSLYDCDIIELCNNTKSDRYITYYSLNGAFSAKEKLTDDSVSSVGGMMVRCTMNNGDIYEGFATPYRKYNGGEIEEENYDILYLWKWDNFDEETRRLVGDDDTKYAATYTPVLIDEIKNIDAILFSHPRWGGRLYNHFFIDIEQNETKWYVKDYGDCWEINF